MLERGRVSSNLLRNKLGATGFHAFAGDGERLNPRVAARRFSVKDTAAGASAILPA
jgi:hypothetical protein